MNKKRATLLVCDQLNNLLGSFVCEVPMPWPQETSDVLAAARAVGLDLAVLRLLRHAHDDASGLLHCTYLALSLAPAVAPAAACQKPKVSCGRLRGGAGADCCTVPRDAVPDRMMVMACS